MTNEEVMELVEKINEPAKKSRVEGYKQGRMDGIGIGLTIGLITGFAIRLIGVLMFRGG